MHRDSTSEYLVATSHEMKCVFRYLMQIVILKMVNISLIHFQGRVFIYAESAIVLATTFESL